MSDLDRFRSELRTRMAAAAKVPRWPAAEVERYMADYQPRPERFEAAAGALLADVVQPRLEALAGLLSSARTVADAPLHRRTCWIAHSDRFPVTAKVEFAIEHDHALEHLFVRYEASLMPLFFQFQPHDKLTLPLAQIDAGQVADWVERRIFEFLETYLRYDRGPAELDEDIVADPVCGMRLRRSDAPETVDYRGHAYFFCSADCRQKFAARPDQFVTFRPV